LKGEEMSTLTKVFVFLVFLLSLVYLGVSATLFSYRIDFKAKWEKEKTDRKADVEARDSTIASRDKEIEGLKVWATSSRRAKRTSRPRPTKSAR
jgi:hypothetical protein